MSADANTPKPPAAKPPRKPRPSDPVKTGRPRGRPAGRKRIDWGAIRDAYVQGIVGANGVPEFESYSSLAARFGVGNGFIRVMGKKEDWPGKRTEYQSNLRAEIARKTIANASEKIAEVGALALGTASKLLRTIDLLLPNPPPGSDEAFKPPSADDAELIQSLSVSFRNITHGARILTGGGDGRAGNGPGGANEAAGGSLGGTADGLSPEAKRAAEAAIGGAASANRAPSLSGAIPGED